MMSAFATALMVVAAHSWLGRLGVRFSGPEVSDDGFGPKLGLRTDNRSRFDGVPTLRGRPTWSAHELIRGRCAI